MAPNKETKVVKPKAKAAAKTEAKTKKAVAKVAKGKYLKSQKTCKNYCTVASLWSEPIVSLTV
jgi:hypothetical protein